MALAVKGNAGALDQAMGDIGASEDDELYKQFNQLTKKVFAFGNAASSGGKGNKKNKCSIPLLDCFI